MENRPDYKLNRYIFLAIIIVFGLLLLSSVIEFFTAFLAAVMFYVLSKSAMEWLIRKKGWKKSTAALLVIIVSFFIILLPISFLAMMLYDKALAIVSHPETVIGHIKHFDSIIQEKFHVRLISPENLNQLQSYTAGLLTSVLSSGFNFLIDISMMYFFMYFMLVNINRMEAAILFYLPFPRNKITLFGNELVAQTFSNAVGVPLIAVVHGLLAFACYLIAGLEGAGFWALVTGFSSILPLVGTGLVWVPAAVYMFVAGHTWQGFFILGWGLLIIGTSDNVIRFLLAKRMADVHPIVTVLGVIAGLKYFGITGLIFGPLMISYFLILLKIYYTEYYKPSISRRRALFPSYFQMPFAAKQSSTKNKKKKE